MKQDADAEIEEIWSLFAQESQENLARVEESLLALERNADDNAQVKILFRALHSFKGAVRMMGLATVESLAHHAEDLIALVRDQGVQLDGEMIDILLKVLDRLGALRVQVLAQRADVELRQIQDLEQTLQDLIVHKRPGTEGSTRTLEAPEVAPDQAEIPRPAHHIVTREELIVFQNLAQGELGKLHAALESFGEDRAAALAQIEAVAHTLTNAAETLGYERLDSLLEELTAGAQVGLAYGDLTTETQSYLVGLKKLEIALFEELTQIEDAISPSEESAESPETNIAWLFRHWNAERVFGDLARLRDIAEQLDLLARELHLVGSIPEQIAKLANEATLHLRAIYQSCIFYHLQPAIHLTLALQDLYGRMAQGGWSVNRALLDLTRAYVTSLGTALEAVREGEPADLSELKGLIQQIENILYLQVDGPVWQVTQTILDVLDLPPEFKEVMTPESMAKFTRAVEAEEQFYTVLADLEQDEAIGDAFAEWMQTEDIHSITNVSVFRYGRTLFNFLIATNLSREILLKSLVQLDPKWQYVTLQPCRIRKEKTQAPVFSPSLQADDQAREARSRTEVATDLLDRLVEQVGEVVADQANLHDAVNRLAGRDPTELVQRLVERANGQGAQVSEALQSTLVEWTAELQRLRQVEMQLSAAIDQLHEQSSALQRAPASELLDPLRRIVQDLSRQQGKMVEMEVKGAELELDRRAMDSLSNPLCSLVWFAVSEGIEETAVRRAQGKPVAGHIMVEVSAREDSIQVVVQDDGRGIDCDRVLARAQELGWLNDGAAESGALELILRPGFGKFSQTGITGEIDLAALNAELQARQGRMSVSSQVGQGTRFVIHLALGTAVVDGMVTRVGTVRYVVPVSAIRRIVKPAEGDIVRPFADGKHDLLRFEQQLVQIQNLSETPPESYDLLVIVEREHEQVALPIDELLGRQQVLVRPLQGPLTHVQHASGCALLAGGEVGVVVNLGS